MAKHQASDSNQDNSYGYDQNSYGRYSSHNGQSSYDQQNSYNDQDSYSQGSYDQSSYGQQSSSSYGSSSSRQSSYGQSSYGQQGSSGYRSSSSRQSADQGSYSSQDPYGQQTYGQRQGSYRQGSYQQGQYQQGQYQQDPYGRQSSYQPLETQQKPKKPFYKKWWFWLIIVIVVLILVVSCSSSGSSDSDSDSGSDSASTSSTSSSDSSDSDSGLTEVEFEEVTVVDNDYLTITLTSLDSDSIWGWEVGVTIVNKSADTTYMVATTDNCAVDGVQIDPLFAEEVAAGKTSYTTVYITDADDLEEAGVEFTDVMLTFHAYDSDDWTADDVVEDATVHIYPYGEDAATEFVRESADSDLVLVDNDYVTVTVIGYDPDYSLGYAVELYVVNKTDSNLMISVDDASINGIMCDPIWAVSVSPGLNSYENLYWFSSSLEDIGITDPGTEITNIEFALRIHNYDDLTIDDYFNSTVTLSPQA